MKKISIFAKRSIIIMLGIIWGCISFIWLGYSILTAGNLMEEPGFIDYVAEGEAMRIYGFIGCALYVLAF